MKYVPHSPKKVSRKITEKAESNDNCNSKATTHHKLLQERKLRHEVRNCNDRVLILGEQLEDFDHEVGRSAKGKDSRKCPALCVQ